MVRTRASFLSDNDSQDVPRNDKTDKDDSDYIQNNVTYNTRHHRTSSRYYRSPVLRPRRRPTYHNDSSTDEEEGSSSDESHFEKKKKKNLAKSKTECLPLNFKPKDIVKGPLRDRQKIGSSLADVDPMAINKKILFNKIGGLDKHVQALKEMILFPLLYPEVFEKYKIHPPRGVLFHGPPGTGKTLVARALCNECSIDDRRVAFFMRKGADCLSKWVGESERQLRLLFDQAYSMRPSIIFFDEIDGIAPVRSTRQDQIHSSIVSTLLALMDGLGDRGEVIVIGATNRLDSIDPALRRPGRFDREFYFPLPSLHSRRQILEIHTGDWNPALSSEMLDILASRTVGYCGADIKALCAETAIIALKRRYPQIYKSRNKLLLNIDEINITLKDFNRAIKKIVPAAQRSVKSYSRPLCFMVKPLLNKYLKRSIDIINTIFPASLNKHKNCKDQLDLDLMLSDDDYIENEVFGSNINTKDVNFRSLQWRGNYRPRFLIYGRKGQGQNSHIGPAILHHYEHIYCCKIDYSSIFSVSGRTAEEAILALFSEVCTRLPSIIYLAHINQWWQSLSDSLRIYLLSLIEDLEPHTPILILATSDCLIHELPHDLKSLFNIKSYTTRLMEMEDPTREERSEFFSPLFEKFIYQKPIEVNSQAHLEELPLAPPSETRKLTEDELRQLRKQEEGTLRELRLFLRDTLSKLSRDRRFSIFVKPVDLEEVPDYLEVIKKPMSLETMMAKIDTHKYECASQFLDDVNLICHNALEYNPDRDTADKLIRHRACALKDAANALIEAEMDSDFEQVCREIHERRQKRGESPTAHAPPNYITAFSAKAMKQVTETIKTNFNEDVDTEIESFGESPQNVLSTSSSVSDDLVFSKRKFRGRPPRRYKRIKISRNTKKPNGTFNGRRLFNRKKSETSSRSQDFDEKEEEQEQQQQQQQKEQNQEQEQGKETKKEEKLETDNQKQKDGNQNNDKKPKENDSNSDANVDKNMSNGLEENKETVKELVIDTVQVTRIMNKVIDMTKNCNVEQLEEIYSCIYRVIVKGQQDWDRNQLVRELYSEIEKFERHRRSYY